MTNEINRVTKIYDNIKKQAEKTGNYINHDKEFAMELVDSLLTNQDRYGYWACPCRLSNGIKTEDNDIICPCIYRDPDVAEFGACFCGLYVSKDIYENKKQISPIPERRKNK